MSIDSHALAGALEEEEEEKVQCLDGLTIVVSGQFDQISRPKLE